MDNRIPRPSNSGQRTPTPMRGALGLFVCEWSIPSEIALGVVLALCFLCTACGGVISEPIQTPILVSAALTTSPLPTATPLHTLPPPVVATATRLACTETPTPPAVLSPPPSVEYTVRPDDTLLELALAYGVPMAAIQLQNGLGDSTVVRVGQVLQIPSPVGWEGATPFWVLHVVQAGETLAGLARMYDLSISDIQVVNGLVDADRLGVGEELILPLDGPAIVQVQVPTPTTLPPTETSVPTPAPLPSSTEPLSATLPTTLPTDVPPSPGPSPVPAAPPADLAAWPAEVFRLINETRGQYGLPPLAYNTTLAGVAQAHANDCLQRGWGSHTGSDGSTVKERMERAGYIPLRWSECWAYTRSPQRAIEMWMDETPPDDPHRRTILSSWLTEVGIGVVQVDWGYYIFADFGTPREE